MILSYNVTKKEEDSSTDSIKEEDFNAIETIMKQTLPSVHASSIIPRSIRQPSSWFAELKNITRFMSASITSQRSIQMME